MNKDLMIENTNSFVKDKLEHEGSGHDWFHIERVYNLSLIHIWLKKANQIQIFS